jgi:hypothetical protein
MVKVRYALVAGATMLRPLSSERRKYSLDTSLLMLKITNCALNVGQYFAYTSTSQR